MEILENTAEEVKATTTTDVGIALTKLLPMRHNNDDLIHHGETFDIYTISSANKLDDGAVG